MSRARKHQCCFSHHLVNFRIGRVNEFKWSSKDLKKQIREGGRFEFVSPKSRSDDVNSRIS